MNNSNCTCHERDSSYTCDVCKAQGFYGHMESPPLTTRDDATRPSRELTISADYDGKRNGFRVEVPERGGNYHHFISRIEFSARSMAEGILKGLYGSDCIREHQKILSKELDKP